MDLLALPRLSRLRGLPLPGVLQVFFGDTYRVLRGGSWATHPQRMPRELPQLGSAPAAPDLLRAALREGRMIAIEVHLDAEASATMARDVRRGLMTIPRRSRRSTSTTTADRSCSSRSPSSRSTTRPGASARPGSAARPRSSPPPASRGPWSSSAPAPPARPATSLSAMSDAGCLRTYVPVDISEDITYRRRPSPWSASTRVWRCAAWSATSSTTSSASPNRREPADRLPRRHDRQPPPGTAARPSCAGSRR